jgi:Fibronectin type III domain
VFLLASAGVAQADPIDVNMTSDATSPNGCLNVPEGDCSLREAVQAASIGDVVILPAGTYTLTIPNATATPGGGSLDVNGITIEGPSATDPTKAVIKEGVGFNDRLVKITGTQPAELENLSLDNGFQSHVDNLGGAAILNESSSTTTLQNVVIDHDLTNVAGGAVYSDGLTFDINNSTFSNDTGFDGGGLYVGGGTVNATGDTFTNDNDEPSGGGGGIYVAGGTLNLTNSTIVGSGNGSSIGGGLTNDGGQVSLLSDTLAGNIRGSLETDTGAVSTTVHDTIIADGFSDGDGNCIASGRTTGNGTTGNAITTGDDLGDNVDQDGSCGENGDGDRTGDPNLAPLANNTGLTETEALLQGSVAFNLPAASSCPTTDERGIPRPSGGCEPGAFQAKFVGSPTATTDAATNVTASDATLNATINFDGEAGAYFFNWGTSPTNLNQTTPLTAGGVLSSDTAVTEDFPNLAPNTKYYFQAVAENATGETSDTSVESFTTPGGSTATGPTVSNPTATSITQTTATLGATINAGGADTHYQINYGTSASYTEHTATTDIGSGTTAQTVTQHIDNLQPGTTYHYSVAATNSVSSAATPDATFKTQPLPGNTTVTGQVIALAPFLPGVNVGAPSPKARVTVTALVEVGRARVTKTTTSDRDGFYGFTNLPACSPADGDTCTVSVAGPNRTTEDRLSLQLSAQRPKVTEGDLTYGRVPDRFELTGNVLGPQGAGKVPTPATDLTVTLSGSSPAYDAVKTCKSAGWAVTSKSGAPGRSSCKSTEGPYELDLVPLTKGSGGHVAAAGPVPAVVTLLEADAAGKLIPVDSAAIDLPANTKADNADPAVTTVPDLHTIEPAPVKPPGRSLTGQVTNLEPFLPGVSGGVGRPAARVTVTLELSAGVGTGFNATARTTRTDANGFYAFENLPACPAKDKCAVAVGSGKTVADKEPVTIGAAKLSVTVQDLELGQLSRRFYVTGNVLAAALLPQIGTDATPATDLTISVDPGGSTKTVFDALKACAKGGWDLGGGNRCHSTIGNYDLGGVQFSTPGTKTQPKHAFITLLEGSSPGNLIPVDRAELNLPTGPGDAVIAAPDLHAVEPVPRGAPGRTLSGQVTVLRPFLPTAKPPAQAAKADATVQLRLAVGRSIVNKTARTDRAGFYSFTQLPACAPGDGDTCTVTATGANRQLEDRATATLPTLAPAAALADLEYGRDPDQLLVSGTVLAPGVTGGTIPHTDLTISLLQHDQLVQIYDAAKQCAKGGWAGGIGKLACSSTVGGYLLGMVEPLKAGQKPPTAQLAVITLLERFQNRYIPIDSADITLPDRNGAIPPTVNAPDLRACELTSVGTCG